MKRGAFRDLAGMAFRNLGRHRVKTIITTLAVAVSVAVYIFVDAWLAGMNLDSRRNIVSYEIGAAKVQSAAYFAKKDELPMYESFADADVLADALAAAGYDAAPRFVFSGTLYSRSGTAPIAFNAVDPDAERKLLRYPDYLEAGRFPLPGSREIALGTLAADKLRVGIPRRATAAEVEELASAAAVDEVDAAFVRSLYGPLPAAKKKAGRFAATDAAAEEAKLALKEDAAKEDIDRFWAILAAAGRMDVRISTVIDMKALPETIRAGKFENELLPALSAEARRDVEAVYGRDEGTGDYLLADAADAAARERALGRMAEADFAGAVRHVNQLIDAVVVGVVNSPNPKTNGNIAFLPIDSLQDEAGLLLEGRVTELLIRKSGAPDDKLPGKDETAPAVRAALEMALAAKGLAFPAELGIYGWKEYAEDYLAASNGDNVSTRVMSFFLFLLAFIGIANTMLMAILERTKETGMLRALGMTDGQVLAAYLIEAGLVGAIGSIVGIALGCLVNIPMVEHGIDFSAMSKEMGGDIGYRVASLFKSTWNPPAIVLTGVAATALSAIAAILPTLRALKMPVTESLRFE